MRTPTSNLVYDPQIVGFDETIFKKLAGTPAMNGTVLRLTSAEICTFGMWRRLVAEFVLTIQTAPTGGHARTWGLRSPALGNRGRASFLVSGTTFKCVAYDDVGTQICDVTVAWDVAWTATPTKFRIDTNKGDVKFYINEILVATATGKANLPLPLHVDNDVADNCDIVLMMARDAESYT